MINIEEFTNAELREMGIPTPCDCWNTVDGPWECPDCGFRGELSEARAW